MAFKKGDVVRLKSGGPLMTVEHVELGGKCRCLWFNYNNLLTEFLDESTLRKAETNKEKEEISTTVLDPRFSRFEPQVNNE